MAADSPDQTSASDAAGSTPESPLPHAAGSGEVVGSASTPPVAAQPQLVGGAAARGDTHDPPAAPIELPSFDAVTPGSATSNDPVSLLSDVELNVTIELGRTEMLVEDVLKLQEGSVVELDKLAGDPVDVFVNERLVARGEVLVLNDSFCVRVSEIVASDGAA